MYICICICICKYFAWLCTSRNLE